MRIQTTSRNLPKFGIGREVAETHGGGWFQFAEGPQLHKFWDRTTVTRAMRKVGIDDEAAGSAEKFASILAATPAPEKTLVTQQAGADAGPTRFRPLSLEAHQRLTIQRPGKDIDSDHKGVECRWQVQLGDGYEDWATDKATEQLTKAGHRLAAMLQEAMDEN